MDFTYITSIFSFSFRGYRSGLSILFFFLFGTQIVGKQLWQALTFLEVAEQVPSVLVDLIHKGNQI